MTDTKVKLDGVIAMSRKLLISYSSANQNCLWGVFVSAPKTAQGTQLLETEAYSGVIILSKGGGGDQPIAPGAMTSQAVLRSCMLRWYIFFNAGVGAFVRRIWKSL